MVQGSLLTYDAVEGWEEKDSKLCGILHELL